MKEFTGESLGTFLLVLFGCGSVAVATLFGEYNSIFQIGLVWGIGVTLAIYLTRHLSCAHLNPAVSIGMAVSGRLKPCKLPVYIGGQFFGAFFAGIVVYVLFSPIIASFETENGIVRGSIESIKTARMFGEYYINCQSDTFSAMASGAAAEALGTFLLMMLILALTEGCNIGRPSDTMAPLFIGLSVTSIICLIAPLTQAGLNPARDFGPRITTMLMGWGRAAFTDSMGGFFWVYILAPIVGSVVAATFFTKIIEPLMKQKNRECSCNDTDL